MANHICAVQPYGRIGSKFTMIKELYNKRISSFYNKDSTKKHILQNGPKRQKKMQNFKYPG